MFSSSTRRPALQTWIVAAVIGVSTLAAYHRSFSGPFVFDDLSAIVNNPTIHHWSSALHPRTDGSTVTGRPLLNLSFAANYIWAGSAVASFHALNLAIHLLAGLALFGIARRALQSQGNQRPLGPALAIALIWVLHPLQTESVTYIVQRAESLMGLLYLSTLYFFIRGTEAAQDREAQFAGRTGSKGAETAKAGGSVFFWYLLSALSCWAGMATKEVMVSAPLIVLFYDRTFISGSFSAAWRRHRFPYLALAATWIWLAWLVAHAHNRGGTSGFGTGIGWGEYLLTQFPAVLHYLRLTLWPRPLIFDYGAQWTQGRAVALPALVIAALAVGSAWAFFSPRIRRPWMRALGFLGLWFFALLAPTSLIPGMRQTMAEHRMYLALAPLIAAGVMGIYRGCARSSRGAFAACLLIAATFGGVTARRNEDYRSDLRLWTDTTEKLPANPFAHNNRGTALLEAGQLTEALAEFQAAAERKPDYANAQNNWGSALLHAGQPEPAATHLAEAVRLDGNYAAARSNFASALATLGRTEEAEAQFAVAMRLSPDSPRILANGGKFLVQTDRTAEGIAAYAKALSIDSDDAEAHFGMGIARERTGELQAAEHEYQEALRCRPGYADAENNLGAVLAQTGRLDQALIHFAAAATLAPANAGFRVNWGFALARSGNTKAAIAQLTEALQINPSTTAARRMLTQLQAQTAP